MSVANVEEAKVAVDERKFNDFQLQSIEIEEMSMILTSRKVQAHKFSA